MFTKIIFSVLLYMREKGGENHATRESYFNLLELIRDHLVNFENRLRWL
jgi:hypothetical protein